MIDDPVAETTASYDEIAAAYAERTAEPVAQGDRHRLALLARAQ